MAQNSQQLHMGKDDMEACPLQVGLPGRDMLLQVMNTFGVLSIPPLGFLL